ncbi:MAG: hypothetical protein FWD18_01100 [Micrococcales bacterium]|nr:hypothetical protein [Micrococcales bacterium]
MVARAVWALLKVLFVAVELVVLGFVGWLALREVFSTLGWTGVDALMVAVVVCVAVALVGLTSSSWGRSAASVRPSSAVPYTWKPSAMANLFVGLAVAVLVWGSVVAALAWGGLGEVIDPVGAPSGWSLPVGIGLLVCAVLVVPWLFWAGDYSRHVDQDAPRGSVTGWVALGGALPSVVLMVAGIVIASRQEVPDHLLGYVDLFGHLDALSWGWAIVVPLTLALLATVYLRAAAIPAAVRTA